MPMESTGSDGDILVIIGFCVVVVAEPLVQFPMLSEKSTGRREILCVVFGSNVKSGEVL